MHVCTDTGALLNPNNQSVQIKRRGHCTVHLSSKKNKKSGSVCSSVPVRYAKRRRRSFGHQKSRQVRIYNTTFFPNKLELLALHYHSKKARCTKTPGISKT